jgi:hypothetical protein
VTANRIVKILSKKGIRNNDIVSFKVENQDMWIGPTAGKLILEGKDAPYLDCDGMILTIDEGYDVYGGTIEKLEADEIDLKLYYSLLKSRNQITSG